MCDEIAINEIDGTKLLCHIVVIKIFLADLHPLKNINNIQNKFCLKYPTARSVLKPIFTSAQ